MEPDWRTKQNKKKKKTANQYMKVSIINIK